MIVQQSSILLWWHSKIRVAHISPLFFPHLGKWWWWCWMVVDDSKWMHYSKLTIEILQHFSNVSSSNSRLMGAGSGNIFCGTIPFSTGRRYQMHNYRRHKSHKSENILQFSESAEALLFKNTNPVCMVIGELPWTHNIYVYSIYSISSICM